MSFPRYLTYKPSGVVWLGEVPAHWEIERLKWLLSEVDTRAEDQNLELLGLSKSLGVVRRSELEQGAQEANDYSKYRTTRPGELVMNRMQAWNGVFALSPYDGMVSPDYAVFRFHNRDSAEFLTSLFRTPLMAGEFFRECRGMGTAFLRLNTSDFLSIKVPLPPFAEQIRIAEFLNRETTKIDELVAEQRQLMDLLKEKRQAVISHAVTRGLNPKAPLKPSGIEWLGDIPERWTATRLKYAANLIIDCPHETPTYSDDGLYLVIRTADLEHGRLESTGMYRVSETEYRDRIRRAPLLKNDIVYGREGERWGHAALVPNQDQFCLGQRMMQFRAADDFDPEFLMWQLNARTVYAQGVVDTVGATSPHVNVSTIRNYNLTQPPLDEQKAIGAFLNAATRSFDALEDEAQRAIDLLQERRTALISAAVTGQIDVRHWQSSGD